ncbi:antitoxin [Streptomyces sp. NPDC048295]|uniref:antitoxin n=1 Tax=Streptomyces sp. NPDC048295 TaxID=3154617 RepID=UPI003444A62F
MSAVHTPERGEDRRPRRGPRREGLRRAGEGRRLIDDKTDGKYSEKIDTGVDKAQGLIERLGDKSD